MQYHNITGDNKKILFVMHEFNVGGAQRVILNLVNNLNKENFEVHLCLFKNKGELLHNLSDEVVLHDLNSNRVIFGIVKFVKLIFKLKPQIVFSSITHVNLLISMLIPVFKQFLGHIKFVSREVNIPSIRAKYLKSSKKLDKVYKYSISNFDHIIAQSNYMKNDIISSYNVKCDIVKVISNPVNLHQIKLNSVKIDSIQLFNSEKINIVAVGVLRNQKGFDLLLKVMTLIGHQYHLNIIGEGVERELLEDLIKTYGIGDKVTLHGFKSNPYAYIQQCDFVVLSSRYEGFPNVILEANACGKYVLAFRCPGVSEEIITEGVNGSFVKYLDIEDFAKQITTHDYINAKSNKVYKSVEKYDVKNIILSYEELFKKT